MQNAHVLILFPYAIPIAMQAKVLREGHPQLGPGHVDTAVAVHNLGCCLDALGQTQRALQLIVSAEQVRDLQGSPFWTEPTALKQPVSTAIHGPITP